MKEKKGFTLIELLVAIVILSIIGVISYIFVHTSIINAKKDVEVSNAKLLLKGVKEDIAIKDIQANNKLEKEQFFMIENNLEYLVDYRGSKTATDYFKNNSNSCDFCLIKITPDNKISILFEGEYQDVRKDYDSNEVYTTPLIISREVTSLYNQLVLFKDIYTSNNEITETKRFVFNNGIIYEIPSEGTQVEVFRITNKTLKGKIKINNSLESEYVIEIDDKLITINDNGDFKKEDNLNSEYSNNILTLYDEIKFVAEKYVKNNEITSEVYFEFKDGKIDKIDSYGNVISDNSISMNSTIMGSGELRINDSKQYQITIYDNNDNIKNNYGSDELYRESLKFSRDVVLLFRNLSRLELLAEKYLNGATSSDYLPSKSDWLVFYYIRQLKYTGSNWNTVSNSDTKFVTYVKNNGTYLKQYFTSKNSFEVNGNIIDLKHMAAVLATLMYQSAGGEYDLLDQITIDSMASWAGDLQTFMIDNLLPTVTDKTENGYKNATIEKLGQNGTSFSMEDMYADTDGWVIYYNLTKNKTWTIKDAFEKFYLGTSTRSYKNRFTSFKNTVLNSSNGERINFSNLTYEFTKQNFEIDLIIFTYKEVWPIFEGYTISNTMSQGVRKGFTEWIYRQIAKE